MTLTEIKNEIDKRNKELSEAWKEGNLEFPMQYEYPEEIRDGEKICSVCKKPFDPLCLAQDQFGDYWCHDCSMQDAELWESERDRIAKEIEKVKAEIAEMEAQEYQEKTV